MCPVYVKGAGSKAAREALASATSSQILPRKGTQCHPHYDIFIHRNTAQQCVDESEITAIMHPDSKFSSLDVKDKVIIDYWGIVNAN